MDRAVRFEFSVMRRIPWQDDTGAFQQHVDEVRGDLADLGQIDAVDAAPDLDRSRVMIELRLFGSDPRSTEDEARSLVGQAIRSAGAYHRGLLPPHDEIRLRPELNAWSGLRTPTWQVRTVSCSLHRSGPTSHRPDQEATSPTR